MEYFFHGNLTRQGALEFVSLMEAKFAPKKLFDFEKRGYRAVMLPLGSSYSVEEPVFDPENKNSAVEIFFQTCHYGDLKKRCLTQLVAQCLSDRFFAQIRTKEQLGYSIASGVRLTKGSFGIRFVMQSLYSPRYLELCLERYLAGEVKYFAELHDEEFTKQVNSLILRKLEKNKNLRQESSQFWDCIVRGLYDFDYGLSFCHSFDLFFSFSKAFNLFLTLPAITESEFLRTLKKEELAKFFEAHLVDQSQRTKIFSARISQKEPSSKPEDHPEEVVSLKPAVPLGNLAQFKGSLPLSPLFTPSEKFFPAPGTSKL